MTTSAPPALPVAAAPGVDPQPVAGDTYADTYAFPLSAQQRGLWFTQQLDPSSAAYNMPLFFRLAGDLDLGALGRALNEVVRRHEILRTTFSIAGGEPKQIAHPPGPVPLPLIDLSPLPDDERERASARIRRQECELPIDLETGPVLRVTLVRHEALAHELLLVMHHIANDGWSEGVLGRELTVLYGAYRAGRASPLPELPIQYADYALWQREALRAEALEPQLQYWRRKLAGVPTLEMPRDGGGPAVVRGHGEMLPFAVPSRLTHAIRKLAQEEQVTVFVVLLAAFKTLLSRYSSQKDIAVGTIIANRNRKETENLIGFFVNTLVLRTDLRGPLTFRELLARVRTTTLEAYEHQDIPFDRLVEELNPERSTATPFLQAGMVFQNTPASELRLGELQLQRIPSEYGYSFVHLGMSINEERDALSGHLMYSTELFARATMLRLLQHFERMLEGAVRDPDRHVDDISLLTADEHRRWVVDWNRTTGPLPEPRFVQQLFEEQARRAPHSTAVSHHGRTLSYGALNARANRLAHHLRNVGVGPERRVGIAVERDASTVVAMLAVLKAGGAYVPLDIAHPDERLAFILDDAGVEVLITTSSLAGRFAGRRPRVVCIEDEAIDRCSTAEPECRNDPGHLAYVMYTSGSTGTPKGVLVEHRSVSNAIQTAIPIVGATPRARFAQLAPLTFDASVAEILTPLCSGGSIAIVDRSRLGTVDEIVRVLRDEAVTVIECTPTFLGTLSPELLPALDTVVVGGEHCLRDLAERWMGKVRLLNAYGPTEATVEVSLADVTVPPGSAGVAIGRPIPRAAIYVLDERLNPVPAGLIGEVWLAGAGLARGYNGRRDLTARTFVPDPFSGDPSSRLYRTGDLGRFHDAGDIEFLGRLDDQVKLRGHRIELGEIEAMLHRMPGVLQCAVVVRPDARRTEHLVAYVVSQTGEPIGAGTLRAHLVKSLPDYMVPAVYVQLEALPLTTAGKVNRRALPAPRFDAREDCAPPRDVVEELLAGIWADVLEIERVGIHDDFFALGGHSLLAAKILARARSAGLELSLRTLFEARTVAATAERIRAAGREGAPPVPPPLVRGPRSDAIPLGFSQQRVWLVDQLEPGTTIYNLPLTQRIRGELRVDLLRAALDEVIRRHEVLRTSFRVRDAVPYQAIADGVRAPFEVVDLLTHPDVEREERLQTLVAAELHRSFDLTRAPLVRAVLYQLGARDHVLCVTVHHIVADALSARVLLHELGVLYQALSEGRTSPLPELTLQYADVAMAEREWLQGDVLARHVDHWRRRLEGCPPALELRTDFPRPAVRTSHRCETRSATIPTGVARGLEELGRRAAATDFMALLAAIDVWLYHCTGQRDILVGAPVSNRRHVETEPLIGFFVNTLVFRSRLDPQASFNALLAAIRTTAIEDYAYQALPFEKLVDELGVPRSATRHPVFQVLFNMVAAAAPDPEVTGLEMEEWDWDLGLAQTGFDLLLSTQMTAEGRTLFCTYPCDLFRAATITLMLESFGELARLIVESPDAPLADLQAQLGQWEAAQAGERKRRHAGEQRAGLRALRRRSALAHVEEAS